MIHIYLNNSEHFSIKKAKPLKWSDIKKQKTINYEKLIICNVIYFSLTSIGQAEA